jgi:2-octaprenylphenol hydroxylase
MSSPIHYDVSILGAGIVGATLACALGRSGMRVALVEARAPLAAPAQGWDMRVSAVTRASERVFDNLGAWAGMVQRRVSPFREMRVWESGGGEVHFDSAELAEPCLGHIVENRVIVEALLERLASFENVSLFRPASATRIIEGADRARLNLDDGSRLSTRLLVGADGADSVVRRHAGIEMRGWPYAQRAVVAVVRPERHHGETAWQRFMPSGPLAFLPLTDGRCSIVWSSDTPRADELMQLDDAQFALELESAFEYRLGSIEEVSPRAAFPLALGHARAYVAPRLALIGDAAHTVHPLAGQGANLGVADAAALAEVVTEAVRAGRDPGSHAVLRRYERWRKGETLLMLALMDGFKRLFGNDLTPLRLVRGAGLGLFDAAGPLKRAVMRRAMGLDGDLPRLARAAPTP